ncbi:LETM1-like domain protein [Flagellimonas lutaonensis]|uniref:LETM1-like domain protein n=2 Tax=Flagellimonas lutaonensis TaxID=516051 RepID=A0A0D5YNC2_9FLAO|nr:LETM1-like domain protein [Allomuricauda lutaonensis]
MQNHFAMNPSASGWINKLGHFLQKNTDGFHDFDQLYHNLKENGFVYGVHLYIPPFINSEHRLTDDEVAKINLLTALFYVFHFSRGSTDPKAFVQVVLDYYRHLEIGEISFFEKIIAGSDNESKLERLIDSRIKLGENLIDRTFGNSITNSLLFIDVLTFKRFLEGEKRILGHARILEYSAINIALHTKKTKESDDHDAKMVQLLAASLTYVDIEPDKYDKSYHKIIGNQLTAEEKQYLLDLTCMAVWKDHAIERHELTFVKNIGADLGKTPEEVEASFCQAKEFFVKNYKRISFLHDKSLAEQYYDNMAKTIGKLIVRNSKRLKKELLKSKELIALISKSTVKELTIEEKKKMRNQLIDIFKSIPSLAIFMLPGGAILLPIFVKLIPTLLPSAFDDNRMEKKQ